MRFALNEHTNDIHVAKTADGTDVVVFLPPGATITSALVERLDERLRVFMRRVPRRVTWTYTAAADELGVSTKWLQRRVREGVIPCHGYGGRRWFTATDMRAIEGVLARRATRE